jgi:serine/threonine protein kinase
LKDCDQLGKYRIDAILGEGGMGVVYKGWHPTLQVYVAIKTIRRSMLGGQEGRELRERFALEARASARLKHDNIVRVYDFEEDAEGDPFFVMDFVEGKSLKDFLARGMHFNLEMSLHIISQILSALAHSHENGVIHRDIKPANIILLEDDSVKIADFGIAHIEDSDLTQTGKMLGTPQYSSPEQLTGGKIDGRCDLYSTGLVLYELLTGERLISKKTEGLKLDRLAAENLAKMELYSTDNLRILKVVITRALATLPETRFQNAADFSVALQPLKNQGPKYTADIQPSNQRTRVIATMAATVLIAAAALGFILIPSVTLDNWLNNATSSLRQTSLPPDQQEKVKRYLRTGQTHELVGRLISPPGSSAYDAYKMALELDPSNTDAWEGMKTLQNKTLTQLEQLIAAGKIQRAGEVLQRAQSLFPDNSDFSELSKKLAY